MTHFSYSVSPIPLAALGCARCSGITSKLIFFSFREPIDPICFSAANGAAMLVFLKNLFRRRVCAVLFKSRQQVRIERCESAFFGMETVTRARPFKTWPRRHCLIIGSPTPL